MSKKQEILSCITDLVSNFLYYDRKEDEDLGVGDIEKAIENKEITHEEIIAKFSEELQK